MTSIEDDEWGTFCHSHQDREAKYRIYVEANSFDAEYSSICEECFNE